MAPAADRVVNQQEDWVQTHLSYISCVQVSFILQFVLQYQNVQLSSIKTPYPIPSTQL